MAEAVIAFGRSSPALGVRVLIFHVSVILLREIRKHNAPSIDINPLATAS
jgi:hypothetical protein